jgi:ABC-type lipoprotein export system ATPase subunit
VTAVGSPAIVARDVVRLFGEEAAAVAALRGLDLVIGEGELAGIVGPSGSGKSSLLRLLAGLDRPSAGTLLVDGIQLERASDNELARFRMASVGVVDQHYWRSISPYLTARQIVELPLALRGWTKEARAGRVDELLARIGLADRGDAYPRELSGGEQQRIAFAAALAPRPRLLLADEPTGELDEVTAIEILALIRELVASEGVTAVVVTHDLLVEAAADRIAFLHDGRVIAVADGRSARVPDQVVDASGWVAPPVPARPASTSVASPGRTGEAAVELRGVSRAYRRGRTVVDAVRDITATFAVGGMHAITGPSGTGKSTLLRLVLGLDRPTAGTVRTLGVDLAGLDRAGLARLRATSISTLSQAPRLVPFLTAVENVVLGLAIRDASLPPAAARERALEALGWVGLEALASALPEVMSGGERARTGLARALASRPRLLVLDEPTAALDRASAVTMIDLLTALEDIGRAASGAASDPGSGPLTILVATHDRDLIAAASSRLDLRAVTRNVEG